MPRPVTMVYQPKGKRHIEYIHRMALRIWADTYDCREDDNGTYWKQSIKDAMCIHRNYLKTGLKVRHPKYAVRISPTPVPPKIKLNYSMIVPEEKGSFWCDPKTGIWMPMSFN